MITSGNVEFSRELVVVEEKTGKDGENRGLKSGLQL
jgi:hypothetical protein